MESILESPRVFHYLLSSNYSNLVIDSTTMWKTKGNCSSTDGYVLLLLAPKQTRHWKRYHREVADNTNALLGKTVTSEPVKKKIGPNTFTVRDDDFWRGMNAFKRACCSPQET